MFIFLDDGEALTIGSEEEGSSVTDGNIRVGFFLVLLRTHWQVLLMASSGQCPEQ